MRLIASLLALFFLTFSSHAADFSYQDGRIYMVGFIEEGDYTDKFLPLASENLGKVDVMYLYSPGGITTDAMRIGIYLRLHDISTVAYSDCYSACSYIWLAGKNLYVDSTVDTYIFIHPPYTYRWNMFWTDPLPADSESMKDLKEYFRLMGLSAAVIKEIVETPTGTSHEEEAILIGPAKAKEWGLKVKQYPDEAR